MFAGIGGSDFVVLLNCALFGGVVEGAVDVEEPGGVYRFRTLPAGGVLRLATFVPAGGGVYREGVEVVVEPVGLYRAVTFVDGGVVPEVVGVVLLGGVWRLKWTGAVGAEEEIDAEVGGGEVARL